VAQADDARRGGRDARAAPDVDRDVVVVAVGGQERGRGHARHHVEAERVAVELEPALDVADVQVQVADDHARIGGGDDRLAGDEVEQPVQVERLGAAVPAGVGEVGPDLARPVGGELDLVAVRVGEVDRLGDAVVGGAVDARARLGQAGRGARELEPRRVQERDVVEAGVAARGPRGRVGDEHEQVGVPARGQGRGAGVAGAHAQAERALVEVEGAVEVGDGEMGRAQVQRGGGRRAACARRQSVRGHGRIVARASSSCKSVRPPLWGPPIGAGGDSRSRPRNDRRLATPLTR
jgi:hypothetical protein